MTTTIKTTLLTAFFFFGLLTGLQAQDKCNLARISTRSNAGLNPIIIVTDNELDKIIPVEKGTSQVKALLQIVSKMTAEGWEIINVTETGLYISYFLRKNNHSSKN